MAHRHVELLGGDGAASRGVDVEQDAADPLAVSGAAEELLHLLGPHRPTDDAADGDDGDAPAVGDRGDPVGEEPGEGGGRGHARGMVPVGDTPAVTAL